MTSKILLVDDEVEFTSILAERMETRGMNVDTAESGAEAISKTESTFYDAIVLDMAMPEMDGITTLKELLKINPDLQIIFLTGKATLEKAVEAVKLGALDFLEKPVKLDNLIAKIEQAKTKKMALVAKREEEKIKKILGKKGW
ncbi:response regulator [bacterium]|nr:response regulator [bacterium]MBU1651761.1 response regulator [bacterium]